MPTIHTLCTHLFIPNPYAFLHSTPPHPYPCQWSTLADFKCEAQVCHGPLAILDALASLQSRLAMRVEADWALLTLARSLLCSKHEFSFNPADKLASQFRIMLQSSTFGYYLRRVNGELESDMTGLGMTRDLEGLPLDYYFASETVDESTVQGIFRVPSIGSSDLLGSGITISFGDDTGGRRYLGSGDGASERSTLHPRDSITEGYRRSRFVAESAPLPGKGALQEIRSAVGHEEFYTPKWIERWLDGVTETDNDVRRSESSEEEYLRQNYSCVVL
ncbi:hypothetical protein OHC33_003093 [Knufia fluminis]|uniref:Uncharacterized protein n=1 Tax=Knufia fluminis TaxID=191047 RepID=A0AAN8ETG1_9EURO|nr:hypothetical protein OHC33_003093 [Knufia fluminis]